MAASHVFKTKLLPGKKIPTANLYSASAFLLLAVLLLWRVCCLLLVICKCRLNWVLLLLLLLLGQRCEHCCRFYLLSSWLGCADSASAGRHPAKSCHLQQDPTESVVGLWL